MIDPATGWFEIFEIPMLDLNEVTAGNYEYLDKSSARIRQLFNNKCLCIYPRPRKVVFDNIYEFKWNFIPLINDFDIKSVCTTTKKPQANTTVERLNQVILNILATKDLYNKIFDHKDRWG